jgi:hypothetical protein
MAAPRGQMLPGYRSITLVWPASTARGMPSARQCLAMLRAAIYLPVQEGQVTLPAL